MVAGAAGLARRAGEDGLLEHFRGLVASQTGCGAVIVPCWVGVEIALPRPHLV